MFHPLAPTPLPPETTAAREELSHELWNPTYLGTWWDRFQFWLGDQLLVRTGERDLAPLLVAGGVILLVGSIGIALVVLRRRRGAAPDDERTVFEGEPGLSAEDYRRRSEDHLRAGRHDESLLDRYRAVTAAAIQRKLAVDAPDLTAHEIGLTLAAALPEHADDARRAGRLFDGIRYGDAHASPRDLDVVARLDRAITEYPLSPPPVRAAVSVVPR